MSLEEEVLAVERSEEDRAYYLQVEREKIKEEAESQEEESQNYNENNNQEDNQIYNDNCSNEESYDIEKMWEDEIRRRLEIMESDKLSKERI